MNKKEYAVYCEFHANRLFDILKKLKYDNYNPVTVSWFLKENKVKYKKYLEVLNDLYSKCEFLMMRYSKDPDMVYAYKELNGDTNADWFFRPAYQTFIEKQARLLADCVTEKIEKIYNIPVHTAAWTHMLYD